ncbi:MAG: TrmH family RNA methyltransferase, partial [Parachlamydiaceae bacterium]
HLLVLDTIPMPKAIDRAHVTQVSEEVMKKITHLPSPPSMIAEFPMPAPSSLEGLKWIIVFDRLQDPGNVGALMRSALALGWEGAFLIESADPFNDKVLRAARESAFRLPFKIGTREDFLKFAKAQHLTIYRADMKGDKPQKMNECALVIGNEGQGVHEVFKEYKAITIPMSEKIDSLNASCAGSILMYALKGV